MNGALFTPISYEEWLDRNPEMLDLPMVNCDMCQGTGQIFTSWMIWIRCPDCGATGEMPEAKRIYLAQREENDIRLNAFRLATKTMQHHEVTA